MIGVSIIIPCFKRVEQTKKTLTLLYLSKGWNSKYIPEVIIADSSPDSAVQEMVGTFMHPKPKYVRPKKLGVASNKNAGAQNATHPILIFCDSDMEVQPETLLLTLQYLQKHPTVGAVTGKTEWRGGPKDGQLDRPRQEDLTNTIDKTTYVEAIYSRFMATYKSLFDLVGGYDEEVFNMRGEGSDLSVRYWRGGYPLAYESTICVHHVHDAPDSVALRIDKPELAIAKDLLLLAYKYDTTDKDSNFIKTVVANFKPFGDKGYFKILEGIKANLELIVNSKPILDRYRKLASPEYPFTFLEIFSQKELFEKCIAEAGQKLEQVRKTVFS